MVATDAVKPSIVEDIQHVFEYVRRPFLDYVMYLMFKMINRCSAGAVQFFYFLHSVYRTIFEVCNVPCHPSVKHKSSRNTFTQTSPMPTLLNTGTRGTSNQSHDQHPFLVFKLDLKYSALILMFFGHSSISLFLNQLFF